ncbi:MAG: DUF2189 domain-containing protein [Steroidobacteraceae bacterium]
MTDNDNQDTDLENLPFVAPCRIIPPGAPLTWLRHGWQDLKRAPVPSLSIGITISLLSLALSYLGLTKGGYWVEIVLLSGFVFVGPVLAIGLYATSRELEENHVPGFGISIREMRRDFSTLMVFALVLLIVFLVWARAATGIHIFFPDEGTPDWREYAPFLAIGSVVGAMFAAITFAASAFSLPMIMDKRVDAITAVVSSIHAVLRNKRAMLVWALLIVLGLLIGFATAMLGLAVIIPVIGHATWHGYRAAIDASAYPSHT